MFPILERLGSVYVDDKNIGKNESVRSVEVTYRKMVKVTKKAHIQNLGKYLDVVKNK